MSNIKIIQGDFNKELKLPIAEGLKAGFPSQVADYSHETLAYNRDLIHNPESTFYGKVEGDSMIEAGICNNDIAVIDRSIEPRDGDVVVGYVNGEFTIKYLDLRHKKDGYLLIRELLCQLEIGCSGLYAHLLGFIRPCHHAAVIVREHHYGLVLQVWPKDTFARYVAVVTVDDAVHGFQTINYTSNI